MLCYYASNQSIKVHHYYKLLSWSYSAQKLISRPINFFKQKKRKKTINLHALTLSLFLYNRTKTQKWKKENEMIKIVVVQLQIIREAIKRTDQVVKSLRNWARAPARMADKRGRFQGSNKKDGVVAVIVDVVAPLPAPALTSSISDSEWLCFLSDDFCWLLNMSNSI